MILVSLERWMKLPPEERATGQYAIDLNLDDDPVKPDRDFQKDKDEYRNGDPWA